MTHGYLSGSLLLSAREPEIDRSKIHSNSRFFSSGYRSLPGLTSIGFRRNELLPAIEAHSLNLTLIVAIQNEPMAIQSHVRFQHKQCSLSSQNNLAVLPKYEPRFTDSAAGVVARGLSKCALLTRPRGLTTNAGVVQDTALFGLKKTERTPERATSPHQNSAKIFWWKCDEQRYLDGIQTVGTGYCALQASHAPEKALSGISCPDLRVKLRADRD